MVSNFSEPSRTPVDGSGIQTEQNTSPLSRAQTWPHSGQQPQSASRFPQSGHRVSWEFMVASLPLSGPRRRSAIGLRRTGGSRARDYRTLGQVSGQSQGTPPVPETGENSLTRAHPSVYLCTLQHNAPAKDSRTREMARIAGTMFSRRGRGTIP